MMKPPRPTGPRLGIRAKLLLASLSLLIIPVLGFGYIRDLEAYLRAQLEQQLADRAAIVATVLREEPELFQSNRESDNIPHIYVRPLPAPIQLDGYADDWRLFGVGSHALATLGQKHLSGAHTPAASSASYRIGTQGRYLYLMVQVKDDTVLYRQAQNPNLDESDYLDISLIDPQGRFHRYILTTIAPGWVNAERVTEYSEPPISEGPETRIKGEWQPTQDGYNIELRIPITLIGDKLAFAVIDVDARDPATVLRTQGTADTHSPDNLGTVVIPSAQTERLLKSLERPSTRIWVIDKAKRVMALSGDLQESETTSIKTPNNTGFFSALSQTFFELLLAQPSSEFDDEYNSASRLDDPVIIRALQGQPAARWRNTPGNKVRILSVAHPVYRDHEVIGAVAIEETSNGVLVLQNRAIEILINLSLLTFALTFGVLITFATRLSLRVRRLRDEAEAAIASDGRVCGEIRSSRAGDELGDLARGFSAMLERLTHYNQYLETMAGKLSHELRTPISVVRSSLDNLDQSAVEEDARTYVERAREGVERLSDILARMSEATRLEQTLQTEHISVFDLRELTEACVHGYRIAHPEQTYELQYDEKQSTQGMPIQGSPELFAQLLDKLTDNARDFALTDTAIIIALHRQGDKLILRVINQGPELPEHMQDNLFDSMVSVRTHKDIQPHLGLGLYIVRLIAQFHHGQVGALRRDDASGAIFQVSLPLAKKNPEKKHNDKNIA